MQSFSFHGYKRENVGKDLDNTDNIAKYLPRFSPNKARIMTEKRAIKTRINAYSTIPCPFSSHTANIAITSFTGNLFVHGITLT